MTYDLLIIGGGINGCAIAREAALNGWRVLLVERDDLASHTSSASTKLIHGGLRYLEYYDLPLVAEALRERERLVAAAPHIIRPMRFVLPHENTVRPWLLVRAGLLLYDRMGGRSSLPRSRGLRRGDTAYRAPLKGDPSGFVYSDAYTDDSRLTLLNAVDAAENGAEVLTRVALTGARREGDGWRATLSDGREVHARALVNAAGPWVSEALALTGVNAQAGVRLVKGSHIVVPRLYEGDHAYILQQPDRRIVFATPYNGQTAIGTTDIAVDRPEDGVIDADEMVYLCEAANRSFRRQIAPRDITSAWSGVRPLYDDGAGAAAEVTRDYVLELDASGPALLSVFGGKITTARHLAEEAVGKLAPALGRDAKRVTRDRAFPGGGMASFAEFLAEARRTWPWLGEDRTLRMARAYGTRLSDLLSDAGDEDALGEAFGAGLTEREARWAHDREWARSPEDVLERRTKLGLATTTGEKTRFENWWRATYPN